MDVTLKNVRIIDSMSEETLCFQATIYVDGKQVGAVDNRGTGGPNSYQFDGADYQARNAIESKLTAWALPLAQEQHPDLFDKDDVKDWDGSSALDLIITDMAVDVDTKRREAAMLRRHCRTKTLFRVKGQSYQDGEWSTVKLTGEKARVWLATKYGDQIAEILNDTLGVN